MRKNPIALILILFSLFLSSCEEMELDPEVENTFGDEDTWAFPNYAEGVLMNAYAAIPDRFNSYNNNFLDVATDNAVTNNYGSAIHDVATGKSLNEHFNPIGSWKGPFDQIRNVHLFMENGLGDHISYNITDSITDKQIQDRLKGEAFFLRAWWGFKLLQDYGGKTNEGDALGYPILTRTLSDEEFSELDITRNSYEECVAQISADIDSSMAYLPLNYAGGSTVDGISGLGRANIQVAQALKSRVMLYAASPAYQPDDIAVLTGMGTYRVNDQNAYEEKWIRAANESQEALDVMVGNIPGLKAPMFNANNTPAEFLWRKYHNDRNLETYNYPPFDYGNGYTGPSQNLVDAFPGANGFPIDDPRSEYDPENPYQNRDPRMNLNILRNGQDFIGDPLETFVGGRDSNEAHPQGTRTGYYLRKWLNIDDMLNPENPTNTHHYHALIRKTELLLNLAEASNEAWGPTGTGSETSMSAVDAIKRIRNNAGINSNEYVDEVAAQGKEEFRKLIQNERRLELAFENHRFYDMRRWLLPLNEEVYGMEITQEGDGSFNFEKVVVEERMFDEVKYYYQPIPFNDQIRSENLINNLGW